MLSKMRLNMIYKVGTIRFEFEHETKVTYNSAIVDIFNTFLNEIKEGE